VNVVHEDYFLLSKRQPFCFRDFFPIAAAMRDLAKVVLKV